MTQQTRPAFFSVLYVAADVTAVIGAFFSAYYARFSGHFMHVADRPSLHNYAKVIILSVPIFLLLFRHFNLYTGRATRRWDVMNGSLYAVTAGLVLFMALTFIYRQENFFFSRVFIFLSWFLMLLYLNIFRYGLNKVERKYIRAKGLETRVILLGINRIARRLAHWFKEARYSGYRVRGVFSMGEPEKGMHIENCEILGSIETLENRIDALEIDEVILTDPKFPRDQTARLMLLCESRSIGFRVVADIYGMVTSSVELDHLNNVPVLGLRRLPLDDLWNRFLKRFFDLAGSLLGLLLVSPVLAFLALLIKGEDGGPVFYAQERVGKDGSVFKLLKFRTMVPNAEKTTGPVWAKSDDTRKTRIGNFLRRTNLDELPQLWNVFSGQMSLVGPRPERPFFVEQFRKEIPRYMARHRVKAGITGWAQVHGYRGDAVTQYKAAQKSKIGIFDASSLQYKQEQQFLVERVQLDLYYLENWSLLFDIEILFRTFFAYRNAF
jgi:exopolysaccharide biosynthesis polyprenyl glycosylphosphotransferase